jgi:hypothetical protein
VIITQALEIVIEGFEVLRLQEEKQEAWMDGKAQVKSLHSERDFLAWMPSSADVIG